MCSFLLFFFLFLMHQSDACLYTCCCQPSQLRLRRQPTELYATSTRTLQDAHIYELSWFMRLLVSFPSCLYRPRPFATGWLVPLASFCLFLDKRKKERKNCAVHSCSQAPTSTSPRRRNSRTLRLYSIPGCFFFVLFLAAYLCDAPHSADVAPFVSGPSTQPTGSV